MASTLFQPLLLLPFLLLSLFSAATSTNDLLTELNHLRTQSPTGVIHLTDALLRGILSLPTPRPFYVLIFFDAAQLHDKPELQLPTLKSEFSLLSSSFYTNNPPTSSKLFFFEIEFKESQSTFSLFGVNSLPHIRLLPPHSSSPKDSPQMDPAHFSGLADSMSSFLESKTSLSVGPIHRPPLFSRKQLAFFFTILLICSPFAIKKLLTGQTLLHYPKFWLVGSLFIYFFSVSGTMHNIIRKMPMFITDRNDPSKLVYFYQGSGMQLGAEGFAVGFLYTIVGLLLGFVSHGLVKVRNLTAQRVAMGVVILVSFWAVKKVIYLDNWKTGYGVHAYW